MRGDDRYQTTLFVFSIASFLCHVLTAQLTILFYSARSTQESSTRNSLPLSENRKRLVPLTFLAFCYCSCAILCSICYWLKTRLCLSLTDREETDGEEAGGNS